MINAQMLSAFFFYISWNFLLTFQFHAFLSLQMATLPLA